MTLRREEAARLRLGLQLGLTSVSDIVKWADAQIVSIVEPEIQLLDLSLMKNANPNDVMGKLGELANPILPLDVIDTVLADAHEALLDDPAFGRSLARNLYYFWVENGYPDEFGECAAFDDEYALADQGIGTVDGALGRLMEFTGGFIVAAK
jgi:hypothetical protein